MAESVIVAAVQMPWKQAGDLGEFRDELYRYLRLAKAKGAGLVVLPELIGTAIAAILLGQGLRQQQAQGGFLTRLRGALRGGSRPTLGQALPQLVTAESDALRAAYLDVFSPAAREHGVWLVAGSLYLRDEGGPVRALCGVFDANGDLRGWQAKLHLADHERALAVPGDSLSVFEAPWGRFGVLLGGDLLYPELGRALAYRGVVGIANPAAVTSHIAWKRLRIAGSARAQENQLFIVQSFLLGPNELASEKRIFCGRSAIWAPLEMTPRDGPLVEIGAESAEGVISTEWNVGLLRQLWQSADERPREQLRGPLFAKLLSFDYESGATIAERTAELDAEAAERAARAKPLILESPTWPERVALPEEPPPPPDEFLASIEEEVREVADLESAREVIAASARPAADEDAPAGKLPSEETAEVSPGPEPAAEEPAAPEESPEPSGTAQDEEGHDVSSGPRA